MTKGKRDRFWRPFEPKAPPEMCGWKRDVDPGVDVVASIVNQNVSDLVRSDTQKAAQVARDRLTVAEIERTRQALKSGADVSAKIDERMRKHGGVIRR